MWWKACGYGIDVRCIVRRILYSLSLQGIIWELLHFPTVLQDAKMFLKWMLCWIFHKCSLGFINAFKATTATRKWDSLCTLSTTPCHDRVIVSDNYDNSVRTSSSVCWIYIKLWYSCWPQQKVYVINRHVPIILYVICKSIVVMILIEILTSASSQIMCLKNRTSSLKFHERFNT